VSEHILFLTGKLAEPSLRRVLAEMDADFSYDVHQLGISVAGLMTADMIRRRLTGLRDADRVVVPGRCRGDLTPLSEYFAIPFERGPDELKDLPEYFGKQVQPPDLDHYDVQIFAEIVDAPALGIDAILARARDYRQDGADVIDLGCLPDTPFPHLAESVEALKTSGFRVSVDSLEPDDLLRGGRAGADYLLSLTADTLWVAQEVEAVPVLIPRHPGDPGSLERAIEAMIARGASFIADSVLDPIHFGFTDSIVRYRRLRDRYPEVDIMMGTGNLTELTEADTTGITALLLGMVSELHIRHVLVTQVSPHCISAVREANLARRIMYYAREVTSLPKQIDGGLTTTHERKPFPYTGAEIEQLAAAVRDPSFRIQVSSAGIHLYNRDGFNTAFDPFEVYPLLGVENDAGHAFYLGVELARAQIAWQLGKRYVQDEELSWGCAVPPRGEDRSRYRSAGVTMTRHAGTKRKTKGNT
jgi:dihydropteroate synthase-like protein